MDDYQDTATRNRTPDGYPPAVSVEALSSEVRTVVNRATLLLALPVTLLLGVAVWVAVEVHCLRAEQADNWRLRTLEPR